MRLIDADKLVKQIPKTSVDIFENCRNCRLLDDLEVRMIISNAPTIEAEPIRHGHWVGIDDFPHETWECDRCGKIVETDEPPNYCENCGAYMKDEVKE